jgi:predicted metalloendopeptidase
LFLRSAGVLAAAGIGSLVVHRADAAFPSSVMDLIDESVDPCEDFYQYACGTWIKNTDIPDNKSSVSYSFDTIGDRNDLVVQEIMKAGWPIVTELYESCMDVDTLNALGNEPLQPLLSKILAVTTTEELFTVAGEVFLTGPALITDMSVDPDVKNASINVLSIRVASLTLSSSYYVDNDTFSGLEPAYRDYISTVMELAGYSPDCNSTEIADRVINVELQLIEMQKEVSESVDTDDPDATYNPITLGEAMEAYPWSVGLYIDGMGVLEDSELTNDTVIIFQSLDYFDVVEEWLDTADLESLKTYLAFRLVDMKVEYFSEDFYDAFFVFYATVLLGQEEKSSRESICADRVSAKLPDLISRYYVAENFDSKSKEDMNYLIESIETAMTNRLEEVDWLDDATFDEAETKLEKVINFIGYEPQNVSYPYVLTSDAFFENREKIALATFDAAFKKIGRPAVRDEMEMNANEVNAFYYPSKNAMVFLAGILQSPFYNHSSHPAQNFGAIGMVVGHELTHGFDSNGRLFDGDGNQRDWWTNETSDQFDTRAQCLRDQYSGFEVLGEDGTSLGYVDGNLTITENIADNGGLGLAYDAYQTYKQDPTTFTDSSGSSGVSDEEADKLFFVSFAQNWCEVMHDEARQQALTDSHSPGQWRTNGVVMNSKDFATTFQCSATAKMNPTTKCVLW